MPGTAIDTRGTRPGIRRTALPVLALTLATFLATSVAAQPLDLSTVEALALSDDPSVRAMRSRADALEELEVAAAQLPDPMLRMGVANLPTDSFELGQEPMTQVQLGVVQTFPRGDSRELRAEQLREQARAMDENAHDLALRILLDVRQAYLEVLKQQRLLAINADAEAAFRDLEALTRDHYSTGHGQQQDVLRSVVELTRVQERASRIVEDEERARARLATWIGEAAWRPLAADWPALREPSPTPVIRDALVDHPRVLALHQEAVARDTGVELAEQAYKPEFSLGLTYGGRAGRNPDGSGRSDLLSLMLTMDVPLFHGKRQDRVTAARAADYNAATFDRDDALRRMRSEAELNGRTLLRQRERLRLYEESLLPEAAFNAAATFDAWRAAVEDLSTLMRARITEFDLQLDHVRLQSEARKTQARLLYLEGTES